MRHSSFLAKAPWIAASAIAIAGATMPACAQEAVRHRLDLPAQSLGASLRDVAVITRRNVVADAGLTDGKQAPPLSGSYTVEQALALLLVRSRLRAEMIDGTFVIRAALRNNDGVAGVDTTNGSTDIVVTGTRIRGEAPEGTAVITIDRQAINRSGYATTQQIVQSIPQNFAGGPNENTVGYSNRGNASANIGYGSSVNLRGLGTSSTLVLVNGFRPALGGTFGAFADLSLIPSSAIERIEILPDGASALYGSDAVAGVVNLILRTRFDGAETRLRYGTADGDFDEVQAAQLFGKSWDTGHLTLAYEYSRRGRLAADDRDFATEDLRPFGGADYRRSFANPGTIIAADGRQFGIPTGQDGTGLTADRLTIGPNLGDSRAGTDLLPRQVSHAVYGAFTKQLDPSLTFSAEVLFADRRFNTRYLPDNFGNVVVPTSNPFYVDPIGTNQPVTVNYDFRPDLGPEILRGSVRGITAAARLEKRLGRWSLGVRSSYGVQTEFSRYDNIPSYFRLAAALADPDPLTAYNVFGDGSVTNRATIDGIRGFYQSQGKFRVWSTSAKFDGPLLALPAGEVKLAIGAEYRTEHNDFEALDDEFTPEPIVIQTPGLPASRSVTAAYAELLVPLFGGEASPSGFHRLNLSLAGRFEHYEGLGSTTNPKVGVAWQPLRGITLRGTYGTSFRTPGFQEIRQGPGTGAIFAQPLSDPLAPSGTSNALILIGNSPDIGPEKARTWTVGAEFAPAFLPGLELEVGYFDIVYRDRIAMIQADYFNFLQNRAVYGGVINEAPGTEQIASAYGNPAFNNPFGIAQADIDLVIDARTQNLSRVTQNGIDFAARYRFDLADIALRAGVNGAYLFRIEQSLTSSSPSIDVVDRVGSPADLRLRGEFGFSWGATDVSLFANHVGGYTNQTVTPNRAVASWTTIDLQLAHRLGSLIASVRDARLALSISNLFDRDPPFVENFTGLSASGYDPEKASPIGRTIALQLVTSW